jgi:DNA-binding NtrC family response regulator
MKSLLLVISEEYLSKGIALALMDHFQSIHTTKNPYEAIEILSKDNIDIVITELNFSTIEVKEYTTKIFDELKKDCNIIIIKDAPFQLEEMNVNQNIIIQQKPISIKTIISIINSIKENSIKTKEGEN